MFEHTNDKAWQKRRQKAWNNEDLDDLKTYYTKTQLKALEKYYLGGNVADIVKVFRNKKQLLLFNDLLEFGPFIDRVEFDHHVEYYCIEYAEKKLQESIDFFDLSGLKEGLCRNLVDLNFELHTPFIGDHFARSMVDELFGDQYAPTASYPTEFSVLGRVECAINPDYMFHCLNIKLRRYLAEKSAHQSHTAYKSRLKYYLSLFPHLTTSPLSLGKLDRRDFEGYMMAATPESIQSIFRALLSNLYGYTHDYDKEGSRHFGFNDDEFRDELRTGIESLKLGQAYESLVDMIHRHQGKVSDIFE